ncbi:hypothetical protein NQL31_005512 [Lotmaria passim]
MNQPRKRPRVSAEQADTQEASSARLPEPLSSSLASKPSTQLFREEDRLLLSFIALSAAQSAVARSAEVVLEAALTTPPEAASGDATPSSTPANSSSGATQTDIEYRSLADRYAEVRVLLHLHCLRCALRDLQECPTHARRTFYTILERHVTKLAAVLPDPLFLAIATVLKGLLVRAAEDDDALNKQQCHVLEVQLMHVVTETQVELLRATRQLTVRAGVLSLRFHHDIPYL